MQQKLKNYECPHCYIEFIYGFDDYDFSFRWNVIRSYSSGVKNYKMWDLMNQEQSSASNKYVLFLCIQTIRMCL